MNGAPAKPMSGVAPSSSTSRADRFGGVRHVAGLERPDRRDGGPVAYRLGDDRPGAGDDVEVDPHRRERNDDVAEEDRRVDPEPAYRLQRDLHGQVGIAARVQHRDALAQLAVLRQRPAGLAHEPHRGRPGLARRAAARNGASSSPGCTVRSFHAAGRSRHVADTPVRRPQFCRRRVRPFLLHVRRQRSAPTHGTWEGERHVAHMS